MDWYFTRKHGKVKTPPVVGRKLELLFSTIVQSKVKARFCQETSLSKCKTMIAIQKVVFFLTLFIPFNVVSLTNPVCCAPSAQQDAIFELVSMAFNVAVWYTKFASRMAGKEKYVLHALFVHAKNNHPFLTSSRVKNTSSCCIFTNGCLFLCRPACLVKCFRGWSKRCSPKPESGCRDIQMPQGETSNLYIVSFSFCVCVCVCWKKVFGHLLSCISQKISFTP